MVGRCDSLWWVSLPHFFLSVFLSAVTRFANYPIFPDTSIISASVSRVPAWVFLAHKMSRILA